VTEAVALGLAGGALAAAVGAIGGVARATATVGAINGALSGWRGTYAIASRRGFVDLGLDSTWALGTTSAAVVVHGLAAIGRDAGYEPDLSYRTGRHVYSRGPRLRRGFAFAVGNVITGAAGSADLHDGSPRATRRRRLIDVHEQRHVRQARVFGPVYPLAYGAWMLVGSLVGVVAWAIRRPAPLARCVETIAYYDNPFEVAAYRADASWPPARAVPALTWRPRRSAS
jgi:hypothetical protein